MVSSNKLEWDQLIPGCRNFTWSEVCTTSHDSKLLRKELLALPEAEFQAVRDNIISIANTLQAARDLLGFAIPIENWYRSSRVEKLVGGSGANHGLGGAVDPRLSGEQLTKFVTLFGRGWTGGLGWGHGQCHIDNGAGHPVGKRRWTY